MTLLIILGLLLLWVGIGTLLLFQKAKPTGKEYRRSVEKRVYTLGRAVEVTLGLIPPANLNQAKPHDIVLVLDHSGSMGWAPGSPLREAVRAAENFTRRLPGQFHIGLVLFDHDAQLLCEITGEHKKVLHALGAVGPGGNTALHLALEKCVEAVDNGRKDTPKTLILLSDGSSNPGEAKSVADRLKQHSSQPELICVGFGPYVNAQLLKNIASFDRYYIHIDKADALDSLFTLLANVISGQIAITGVVEEAVNEPGPFRLNKTGGLYPIGIQTGAGKERTEDKTRIMWSVPVLEQEQNPEPIVLTYELVPRCTGWHAVAGSSKAIWKMSDGNRKTTDGPNGPKVLVLPQGLGWTWPLLNPLFCLVFKGKCPQSSAEAEKAPEYTPLPVAALPALIPPPNTEIYAPKLRPALVIGLGETGERIACNLKYRIFDRGLDPDTLEFLAVRNSDFYKYPPVRAGNCTLDAKERVILKLDIRPYLEGLRTKGGGLSGPRAWIPWQQWLADTAPLTDSGTGDNSDRRKARLALLLQSREAEHEIRERLTPILAEDDGMIFIVGEAGDAEASGMAAEAAHICASQRTGVTVALARAPFYDGSVAANVAGMAMEFERMSVMRGEAVVSDRDGRLQSATRLFDRIISVSGDNDISAAVSVADLVWAMLAYPETSLQMDNPEALCYRVNVHANRISQLSLWESVREKTLSFLVNQQWLGLSMDKGEITFPAVDVKAVNEYVTKFWEGKGLRKPAGTFLRKSAQVARGGNPLGLIMDDADEVPLDKPYHIQIAYCDQERKIFSAYLETWCAYVLEAEQAKKRWGLPVLRKAIQHIVRDIEQLTERVNKLSGNEDFVNLLGFVSSMYMDYQSIFSGLREDTERWIAVFIGWQPEMDVSRAPGDASNPIYWDIEKQRQNTGRVVHIPNDEGRESVASHYRQWLDEYGDNFLQQLRFQPELELVQRRLRIRLRFRDQLLKPDENIPAVLRDALNEYKNIVLQWPATGWMNKANPSEPNKRLRLGKFSEKIYPRVAKSINEEDPFYTAALLVEETSPQEAFAVTPDNAAIYAWAEEANAARIANKIRNILSREPAAFSAKLISLMRDTKKLYDFMGDFAEKRVYADGQKIMLERGGTAFHIGPSDPKLQGLELFEDLVRQAVALEVSLSGQKLLVFSNNWAVSSPDEAVRLVEAHALVKAAAVSPDWKVWRDVIRGLVLEHGC
ncbi:MAG: VWA domain-containing protein [Gammaproteobacteria bacterium]|nr:VWA domain-containing protein [Gammaproteobacteria bacterium]